MKNMFLVLLLSVATMTVCAQRHRAAAEKKLVITDISSGEEVKRIDFSKIFSYKIKGSTIWRNGFVTGFEKDTVRLSNGIIALKNFDVIKQNRRATPFLNTTSDVCFYGGLSAISTSILFYVIEKEGNTSGDSPNNYPWTKGSLIVGASMGVIGGVLKLLTRKKSIQLGDRFKLVIQ